MQDISVCGELADANLKQRPLVSDKHLVTHSFLSLGYLCISLFLVHMSEVMPLDSVHRHVVEYFEKPFGKNDST